MTPEASDSSIGPTEASSGTTIVPATGTLSVPGRSRRFSARAVLPPTEPWEKLHRESGPAWEAFVLYRDAGPSRSITKVAARVGKHPTLLSRWSVRWRWVERCDAWDRHLDRTGRKALERRLVEVAQTRLEVGQGLIARAGQDILNADEPLKPTVAARVLEAAVRASEVGGRSGAPSLQGLVNIERAVLVADGGTVPTEATD